MRSSRRKVFIQTMERAALGLGALDLLLWVALVRPYEQKVATEQQRFQAARRQLQEEKGRVAQLEKIQTTGTDSELSDFLREHVPPRRRRFSRALRLVQRLTQESGVQLSGPVNYRPHYTRDEPLERLGIEVSVQGPFPSLMNFSHALETTKEFVLMRSFSFEVGEGGVLALRLAADLYVTP